MDQAEDGQAATPRVVGPAGSVAIVAGTMLGVGILLTPPVVAAAAPGAAGFYGLWLLGALTALCGAAAYAELGAMYPRAGGDVVFQQQAFGPSVAFASGSVTFALAFAGSIAAMAVAVGTWQLPPLAEALGLQAPDARVTGLVIVLTLSLVNALGARIATGLQVAATVLPLLALAGLATWALATATPPPPAPPPSGEGIAGLAKAYNAVYFTYAGWPAVVYLAGEVRRPGRSLPVGMLGGTLLVTALYLLLCVAFRQTLGVAGLAEAGEAGSALATAVLGPTGGILMAGLVLVALLASINGTVLGGARIAVGMAEQRALPAALAGTSARTGAPVPALWLQAALAVVLVLSGSFETILALTGLAMMVVGSVTVLGMMVLRRTRPEHPRPYRATGWPLSPVLYLLASVITVAISLWSGWLEGALLVPASGIVLLVALGLGHAAWTRLRS